MEPNPPADETAPTSPSVAPAGDTIPLPFAEPPAEAAPIPEPPEEAAPENSDDDVPAPTESDELSQLAEASQKARLSVPDEERMGNLLKEAILGGRSGVARAVQVLPRVPWIVGVRAVESVWPELTAGFRTQLLSGLGKDESDAGRRIRLSIARALFKIDVPVALKLSVAVSRELRDKDAGTLTSKQAQIFANVFIGRGKPWLAQLPLTDLKPADIDALVHCAVLAVFTLPHPPVTQLGVLKWASEQGWLSKLDPVTLEVFKKGVMRWSGKWQGALRKEVGELPEEILAALKPAPEAAPAGEAPRREREESEEARDPSAENGEKAEVDDDEDDEDEDDEDDEDEDDEEETGARKERPVYEPRPQKAADESRRDRPVYTPRNAGANVPRNFNLSESLRNIEAYANSLRAELATAKSRQKEDRRRPEKFSGPIITGEPTLEELARLNQQLEARNVELQERINDLTQHSEDLATSMGAMSSAPVSDADTQLRTLLALKLQEDFADFVALKKETGDIVVQQHYRTVLEHVFEVLQQLQVPLKTE